MRLPCSYLYVPATRPERVVSALRAGADAVIVDLEDTVPIGRKVGARGQAIEALAEAAAWDVELWVRINAPPLREDDARAMAGLPNLTGLVVAKAETPEELIELAALLAGLDSALILEPLIESAPAVLSARELARAPRVRRMHLGEVDLAADLGVEPGPDDLELLWARSVVVAASAAEGLEAPLGPVSTDFRDLDTFRAGTQAIRRLGFWGRACIHPAQVEVVNEVFSPTSEELAWADDVTARLAAAERAGSGVAVDAAGRMIDEAVARRARRVLDRHE